MKLFLLIIVLAIIMILIYKIFKLNKIIIITISIAILSIIILSLLKFGIIDKVITEDEKNNSIATISYNKSVAIDTGADYTYYIYKDNDIYSYILIVSPITIAGAQDERIIKRGSIKNQEEIEKIIDEIGENIDIYFYINNSNIEKEEFINKLFAENI